MDFPISNAAPDFTTMPDTRDQINRTITLYGTGILHNTSECHITSDEITIFPDLHVTLLAELHSPDNEAS